MTTEKKTNEEENIKNIHPCAAFKSLIENGEVLVQLKVDLCILFTSFRVHCTKFSEILCLVAFLFCLQISR